MKHVITLAMDQFTKRMKRHAESGLFDGQNEHTVYWQNARQLHTETGTSLIFTRDVGHHSSGWWKNPDYERCYHLSVAFWDVIIHKPRPFETDLARAWVSSFYGDWIRYIWEESGSAKLPDALEVRHYRVFCNPKWQPIVPRGEVYSRELIEAGWKSWSDQQYDKQA